MQNAMWVMTQLSQVTAPPAAPPRAPGMPRGTLTAIRAGLSVPVAAGRHPLPGDQACLMELASVLAREPWGDHPASVHPVLAAVARAVNDRVSDGTRDSLAPLVPRMIGTADAGPGGRPRPERCARLVLLCAGKALEASTFMAAEMNSARLTALSVLSRPRSDRPSGPGPGAGGDRATGPGAGGDGGGSAIRRAAASLLDRCGLLGLVYPDCAAAAAAQAVVVTAGADGGRRDERLSGLLRACVGLCVANIQEAGGSGA
jgi:hypothetical protein